MAGVADALAEAQLSLDDAWIVEACGTDEERRLYGRGGAEVLLDNARDVTAIIALSAPLASSILKAAAERGIRVPEQVSVAGFDDPPEAALTDPPLTAIRQPVAEKGRMAARLLFEPETGRHVVLPVELKIRSSTARAPG